MTVIEGMIQLVDVMSRLQDTQRSLMNAIELTNARIEVLKARIDELELINMSAHTDDYTQDVESIGRNRVTRRRGNDFSDD